MSEDEVSVVREIEALVEERDTLKQARRDLRSQLSLARRLAELGNKDAHPEKIEKQLEVTTAQRSKLNEHLRELRVKFFAEALADLKAEFAKLSGIKPRVRSEKTARPRKEKTAQSKEQPKAEAKKANTGKTTPKATPAEKKPAPKSSSKPRQVTFDEAGNGEVEEE